ncbi:glycosyl hydrolase [Bacillus sp. FJAT-27264]|uniref:glycoside hydrolase family 30 protein n=1 Tax=Paenibacillus sp. (strain DSM 101736 / FJAT-27264) TaxID=1850362 RepID=UPI000807F00D|nr:glycoside hydrolase family 30 beta sandwich domain-containing protein [Bacillus sp. FJAT-27264]OBZ10698.1 glycosyl hydrolase [Bacillus sp. FJAT-27264]
MTELIIYESKGEGDLFVERTVEALTPVTAGAGQTEINLDMNQTYQEMDGFGASFTDSSAYLIHQVLSAEQRSEAMTRLFDAQEGIGLSVLRNPMGASDYARMFYSYDDRPEGETDPSLEHFTIAHDEEDVIPLVQEALKLNPAIKLFASPWSAPAWMKTSGSMKTGELKQEFYSSYADYFVRFIQAYKEKGLHIYAVTPQNEPLYEPAHYPSMLMLPEAQADFVKNHLKPRFIKGDLDTKILCYDHNWDRPDYPLTVMEQAKDSVDGVAWHWYGGKPAAQSEVFEVFAGKEVHFSEGSGGEWIPPFEQAFSNVMRTGIEILRNHSKSFILWNMALDEKNGPTVPGFGKSTCRGILLINQQTGELEYTLDYYALAHFSKVIRPGALRIGSSASSEYIRSVAFTNTDSSVAIVLFNDSDKAENVTIKLQGQEILSCNLVGKSAVSVLVPHQ